MNRSTVDLPEALGFRLDLPTLNDLPAIHRIYSDPRLWTHFPSGRHETMGATEKMVRWWIEGWERDGLSAWIVRDASTHEVLGNAGCTMKRNTFWNLGYRLAYEAHGRGIASHVSIRAVEQAHEVGPDLPVIASLLEHNLASASVAAKVGLTPEFRGTDTGNPSPDAIRVVYADRPLTPEQLEQILA